MKLLLLRYSSGKEDTLGLFMVNNRFACYILEDQFQTEKVFGETRIPEGTYKVKFRTKGGKHIKYLNKFGPAFHSGMLEICDVPGFTDILIHIGNRDNDTAGCLLVGDQVVQNITEEGFVGSSTQAYKRIYPIIANALENNEEVTLEIKLI